MHWIWVWLFAVLLIDCVNLCWLLPCVGFDFCVVAFCLDSCLLFLCFKRCFLFAVVVYICVLLCGSFVYLVCFVGFGLRLFFVV